VDHIAGKWGRGEDADTADSWCWYGSLEFIKPTDVKLAKQTQCNLKHSFSAGFKTVANPT